MVNGRAWSWETMLAMHRVDRGTDEGGRVQLDFLAELGSAALSLPKSISPRTNLCQEQSSMPQRSKVGPGKLSAGHHNNRQLSALWFPSLQHSLPLDLKTTLQKQANIPVSTVK